MSKKGNKVEEANETSGSYDDFAVCHTHFDNIVKEIERVFENLTNCYGVVTSSASTDDQIKSNCEEMFKCKGKIYQFYQQLLDLYAKMYNISKKLNKNTNEEILMLDEELQKIKNLSDVARKQTRHASQIYEKY